jgi:hypothetical protein
MILAPLVGIILNLLDASSGTECREHNDVVGIFASMDCPKTVHYGFQYLLDYNWVSSGLLLSLSLRVLSPLSANSSVPVAYYFHILIA